MVLANRLGIGLRYVINRILIATSSYLALAVFAFMITISISQLRAQNYTSPSTQIALLEQRSDQMDHHLENIDKNIQSNQEEINELRSDQSQIRGIGIGIGALISLFQLIQVVLQLRIKKNGVH